jgi:sodium-dependent dicarboxylate transporter 2/3/5
MLGFITQLAPTAPEVSFFQWMIWGSVAMILYFILAYFVLMRMFPADVEHIEGAREFINDYVRSLGKWTRAQKNTLFAFSVAVVLWVSPSIISIIYGPDSDVMKSYDSHFPEAIAAMVGGLLLFFLPVDIKKGQMTMTWKEGMEGIEWGTLLLFGGGMALGGLMYSTGLSQWVGQGIKDLLGNNPSEWVFVGVFCVVTLLLSEITSHTASINLIGPIAISTAAALGVNPLTFCIALMIAVNSSFATPIGSPTHMLVYATGNYRFSDFMKIGLPMNFIILAANIFIVSIIFPL